MKERSRLADVFYVLTIMGTVWGMIWLFPFIWTVVILGIKQCFSCRLDFSAQIDKLPFFGILNGDGRICICDNRKMQFQLVANDNVVGIQAGRHGNLLRTTGEPRQEKKRKDY